MVKTASSLFSKIRSCARSRAQQLGQAKGLGDIVVRPRIEAAHHVLLLVGAGQHDDRHLDALPPQARAQIAPVAVGQPDIENDRVIAARRRRTAPPPPPAASPALVAPNSPSTASCSRSMAQSAWSSSTIRMGRSPAMRIFLPRCAASSAPSAARRDRMPAGAAIRRAPRAQDTSSRVADAAYDRHQDLWISDHRIAK
jgi:hypothetical protein